MLNEGPSREQIREQLDRIVSGNIFAGSENIKRLLEYIVENTLARKPDELREMAIGINLYNKEYDPRKNSNVRVDANKLRAKLNKYYAQTGSQNDVVIEIPTGGYQAHFTNRPKIEVPPPTTAIEAELVDPPSTSLARIEVPPRDWKKFVFLAVAGLMALVLVFSLWSRTSLVPVSAIPVQITFDSGFTSQPAISPDGRTLAYASDRGKDKIVHIWIQSGQDPPRQLTDGSVHDFRPDLSPDGKNVVFRSSREGGGIFVVPTSGGAPRLIAKGGFAPRFSPDSRWIAYSGMNASQTGHIFAIPITMEIPPRQIDSGVSGAACPVWTPDGSHILFLAQDARGDNWDYWVSSAEGRLGIAAHRIGIQAALRRQNLPLLADTNDCPQDWLDDGIIFMTRPRDAGNIFKMRLGSSDWSQSSPIEMLTLITGAGAEVVRVARDARKVVYVIGRNSRSVWSVDKQASNPVDFLRVIEDVTIRGGFIGTWPALSGDGKTVCFVTERTGLPDIFCKDLNLGSERFLGSHPKQQIPVFLNGDGQRVAFVRNRGDQSEVIIREVSGQSERQITQACLVPLQWTADERYLLCTQKAEPYTIDRITISTGEKISLLAVQNLPVNAQVSADGNWLALVLHSGHNGILVGYLIPMSQAMSDSSKWIKLVEEPFNLSLHWSPDGSAIYFWQISDGFRCLWGKRLDPATKHPIGGSFPVLHRHAYQAYPQSGGTLAVGGTAKNTRMVMTLSDSLSNLWQIDIPK